MSTDQDRVKSEAASIAADILEQQTKWQEAQVLDNPVEYDGEQLTYDDIVDRIHQEPLSIDVRSGWYQPGRETPAPEEYNILLGTGGPAFRIVGRLDENLEPETAVLEFQDWFTPWEPYVPANQAEEEALLWYARLFYFGD